MSIFVAVMSMALDVSNIRYEGIAKVKGKPIDFWATIAFNGDQARVNLAKSITIKGSYNLGIFSEYPYIALHLLYIWARKVYTRVSLTC